jgi:hypothetical protein
MRECVMANAPLTFKEADIARAIRGARKAGLAIAAVRISKDGTIEIIPGTGNPADQVKGSATDIELEEFEAHHG